MERDWVNVDEASKMLGISSSTVRDMIARNKLKAQKVGKYWRILKSEIDKILGASDSSNEKDIYIKELECEVKCMKLQIATFKELINTANRAIGEV